MFKTKKAVSILLMLVLLLNLPVFCQAEQVRYFMIEEDSASLTKSGFTAICSAELTAKSSTSLSIEMRLQKSTSSGYTDVDSWTKTGTGTYLELEKTKTINIFSSYRLIVTFTAGSDSETVYRYC